jgi:hypothetical protein
VLVRIRICARIYKSFGSGSCLMNYILKLFHRGKPLENVHVLKKLDTAYYYSKNCAQRPFYIAKDPVPDIRIRTQNTVLYMLNSPGTFTQCFCWLIHGAQERERHFMIYWGKNSFHKNREFKK